MAELNSGAQANRVWDWRSLESIILRLCQRCRSPLQRHRPSHIVLDSTTSR